MLTSRAGQGFNYISTHGLDAPVIFKTNQVFAQLSGLQAFDGTQENGLAYWRQMDSFLQKAENAGVVFAMGVGVGGYDYFENPKICGTSSAGTLSDLTIKNHKAFFRHLVARYGSYPVTFLFTQEYNQLVQKKNVVNEVKRTDPYRRALTLHEAVFNHSEIYSPARTANSISYVTLQQGHFVAPANYRKPTSTILKPILEAELNWEGFELPSTEANQVAYTPGDASRCTNDPDCLMDNRSTVVSSFLQALFARSAGYNYGAQGSYAGIIDINHPASTGNWGPLKTTTQALGFQGAKFLGDFKRGFMTETSGFASSGTVLNHSADAWR